MSIFDPYGMNLNPNLIQSFQQRPMVPNPPPITTTVSKDLDKVNGIESAKQYSMPPNSRVALFDINDDVFYIKETDSSGYPSIRKFRFVEEVESTKKIEENKYLTIEEFNKFKEELLNGQQPIQLATNTTTIKSKSGKSKTNNEDVSSI